MSFLGACDIHHPRNVELERIDINILPPRMKEVLRVAKRITNFTVMVCTPLHSFEFKVNLTV